MAKAKGLSIEQQNAIDLLILGKSDTEVAEQVGVTRQTVWGWRNGDYAFREELKARRLEVWGYQVDRLRGLVASAVEVLAADLESEDPKAKRVAAIHILRAVGLYGRNLEPSFMGDFQF